MVAPSLLGRRCGAALLLLLSACATSGPDNTITKHDFSGTGGSEDLAGADLTGTPPDDMTPLGDMSRIGWTDVSYTTTNQLWSVWSDGTNAWTLGDNGLILKSTGGAFAPDAAKPAGVTTNLYGVFGVGTGPPTSPLLAVGTGGIVLSNNGTTWGTISSASPGNFSSVWIAPDGVAFIVGQTGICKKQNGAGWDTIGGADTSINGVWGIKTASGYTVYAVGNAAGTPGNLFSRIWKYNGTNFVAEAVAGTGVAMYGIWGSGENDIYAVGDQGTLVHSTGSGAWAKQTVPVTTALEAIGGAGPDEVYAVGDNGIVLQKYDSSSSTWVKNTLASPTENRNFFAVWANKSKVYVVGAPGSSGSAPILTK